MSSRRHKYGEAPDWFGCGRIITTESWKGFLAARKAYHEEQDRLKQIMARQPGHTLTQAGIDSVLTGLTCR